MANLPRRIRQVVAFAAYRHSSIRAVRAARLTYLEPAALADLIRTVRTADRRGDRGTFIEAGCALGGSAIVMARAAQRPVHVYDLFGMPPPPSGGDGPDVHARYEVIANRRSPGIDGHTYYGYVDDLLGTVRSNFLRHGVDPDGDRVVFVKGAFKDTLHPSGPVSVAHIDCDRYASVQICLDRIAPHLVSGGVMVFDDYDSKSGCRKAVDEYFATRLHLFALQRHNRLHAVRRHDSSNGGSA